MRWTDAVFANLAASPWVILLASRAASTSPYVQQECWAAMATGKKIIPVVWEMSPADLPGWLDRYQALDLRGATIEQRLWCKRSCWLIISSMHQSSPALFHGRHFDRSIIILCVRWYITYKLSYRDLVEIMTERGVGVSHTTILRWVQRYVPEFEKRWRRYARPVGTSWRVDETYIRVRGRWTYLYRAVDQHGLTVDSLLREHRDIAAAKRFFTRAIEQRGTPEKITLDGYPATHAAVAELKESGVLRPEAKVRTSKYLNNLIEQDHRRVKQCIYPMLGFKRFANAAVTISGIELVQKLRKGSSTLQR